MKTVIEQIRSGSLNITLSERELATIASPLSSNKTVQALTENRMGDWYWSLYRELGVSVFDVREGKANKIPALQFDAKMVEIGHDVPVSAANLNVANLPPRRIGVSVPMDRELVASMSDGQLMSFVAQGLLAVDKEIMALSMVKAFDNATVTAGALDTAGLQLLENTVKDQGIFFGAADAFQAGKAVPIKVGGDDFLFKGDAYGGWISSHDGIYGATSKKLTDSSIIGYGNFRFAAVLLYSDYHVMIDPVTSAKNGEIIFTFYQMANIGVIDASKFAVTAIGVPKVYNQPTDASIVEGNTLVLSADSFGATSFLWKKDGVALINGGDISGIDTERLVIKNMAVADAGDYTVDLINGSGTTTSAAATVSVA